MGDTLITQIYKVSHVSPYSLTVSDRGDGIDRLSIPNFKAYQTCLSQI